MKRFANLSLLVVWIGGSGCAATSRRDDGSLSLKPGTFAEAPAPAQARVSLPAARRSEASVYVTTEPQGVSKYFPGLRKGSPEPNPNAATTRSSWFGHRKIRSAPLIYSTDSRSGDARGAVEPSILPVALRVPTDHAVTTTATDSTGVAGRAQAPPNGSGNLGASAAKSPNSVGLNSAPRGIEPDNAVKLVTRMPEMPSINPRERPGMESSTGVNLPPATTQEPSRSKGAASTAAADDEEEDEDKPDSKKAQVAPTPADPSRSLGLPQPTLPISYLRPETMAGRGAATAQAQRPGPVLASPQVAPTSRVAPSPQVAAQPPKAVQATKPHCLGHLCRKIGKLGEFANPFAARTH